MKGLKLAVLFVLGWVAFAGAAAAGEVAEGVLDAKVVDVSIFKSGGAVFRFEGEGVVKDGMLVLKDRPNPAFGTLWFYSLTESVETVSIGSREVSETYTEKVPHLWDLIGYNQGKQARLVMKDGPKDENGNPTDWDLEGVIRHVNNDHDVFLETEDGVLAVNVKDIRYAKIKEAKTTKEHSRSKREMFVTLKGAEDGRKVQVGYTCLQTGVRWLPAYRMDLEGEKALLSLSASVIN